MTYINGGVCAAKGFKASGIHVGVKTNNPEKKDLALIVADCDCTAAAVYTRNAVKAAPLLVTMRNLTESAGHARAVFANSGNANACAPNGEENALAMCGAIAAELGLGESQIIVASTGVIGQILPVEIIKNGVPALVSALSPGGSKDAAAAIMTTDLAMKESAVEFLLNGKPVRIGGITKGSGMIHPNMGTMLSFLTTDCAISPEMLHKALVNAVNVSFNRVSIDGDTSTNDMVSIMASGLAGNDEINMPGPDFNAFSAALCAICIEFAKKVASDGEGATHLLICRVHGAESEDDAEALSKSVISSTLTKAAMFGADANWGRILCAMGYSGVSFDPARVSIAFRSDAGDVAVCENGQGLPFDEGVAKKVLSEHDIVIDIGIGTGVGAGDVTGDVAGANAGAAECTCWGCDITYDYIRINGDYRT